ncbi:MAG: UDP-N-acetylmuramoyl-tripeptide--D-alanyl-D-alanine ligase [Candidatus Kaiserbacteria bacterium]|nr:MAG: UDP-N-acetylmuramoyl-tripeptide--D-alanyl-D-alanine ligase [Candidatus Kaiserbacteria bacterium]
MDYFRSMLVQLLTWEARIVLSRRKPKIIAITGSVGKTSGKDAIYAALSDAYSVRRSEKSYNSEFGVPLTVLGLENAWRDPWRWILNVVRGLVLIFSRSPYPEWLILEVGADRPGDISRIARWLRPDIAVITGVPEIPAHVEYFDSPDQLAREKRELARYVKHGGKLVLNGDDSRMVQLCADFRGMTLKYGLEASNDFRADDIEIAYEEKKPTGMRFRLERRADLPTLAAAVLPIAIRGALGRPRVYAALAALAVGEAAGVDQISVGRALESWEPPPGRMRILPGVNGSVIIDDTYNSSPVAALAALDTLKALKCKRRIALLGDMLELGRYASEAHRNVGRRAAKVVDLLWTVGFRSRASGEAALDEKMSESDIREYEQTESRRAGEELRALLKPGDVVLVKGSQSMRMEKAVQELLAEPSRAGELLVRQDSEWKKR